MRYHQYIQICLKDAQRAISWFDNNYMDANPDKFQCISLDRFGRPPISISIEGNTIPSSDSIKVLGVTLDSSLKYNKHISNLCSKASIQINAMKRIGKYLNTDCRISMYKSFISSNFFILSGVLDVLWEIKFW